MPLRQLLWYRIPCFFSGGDQEDDAFDDTNDVVVVVLGSSTAKPAASNPPPRAEAEPTQPIHPLRDCAPSVTTVLKEVRASHHIKQLFTYSEHYCKKSEQDTLFDQDFWDEEALKLLCAINKYTPKLEKDIEKKAKRFEDKKRQIIQLFTGSYDLFDKGSNKGDEDKHFEMKMLLPLIGIEFTRWFQTLITPPGGRRECLLSKN